jgi:hypothetical protein
MARFNRSEIIGLVGIGVLLAAWLAVLVGPYFIPANWVPRAWILALIALPCAAILGVIAGRRASRWWYLLTGASLLSAGILLAGVAV